MFDGDEVKFLTRVGLYTLGCKVSQYETEAVSEAFSRRGFAVGNFDEANDVYVINSCTVTAESDRKCRQMIRRAHKYNPKAGIIVMGCYSQRMPEEILKLEGVFAVLGTQGKLSAVELAEEYLRLTESGAEPKRGIYVTDVSKADFEPMCIERAPRSRAYVKIEDGCDAKCTYCAIADARGRVRSKRPEDVIREVSMFSERGVREIVLTGIEVAAYGKDFGDGYGLSELLSAIDSLELCTRIRLGSLAPELLTQKLIDKLSALKSFTPHFHLSVQSGSDSVLRGMKRRYTRSTLLDTVAYIKAAIPRATFTADLMVGFPNESEADFLDSVSIVNGIGLLDAHVFAYSRRSGTPAADYQGQIPEQVKRARSERLIAEKNASRDKILEDIVELGEPLPVIAEVLLDDGYHTSHSDTYAEVKFLYNGDESIIGKLVYVIPVSQKDGVIYGELVKHKDN